MDDDVKIKVLMIYFRHWGVEEARQRRQRDGVHSLMRQIHGIFFRVEKSVNGVGMRFHFLIQEVALLEEWVRLTPDFFPNMIDKFLSPIGGYPFQRSTRAFSREQKLARRLGLPIWMLYRMELSEQDLLSVDSIVAW